MKLYIYILSGFIVLSVSCCHDDFSPKKREFQRIDLPAKKYIRFQNECPYSFNVPDYAAVMRDSLDQSAEPCWLNIYYPFANATLHLSYKDLTREDIQNVIRDTRTLVYKHTIKAEEIAEVPFRLKNGNEGIRYELTGNTATSFQFYITDKKKHYLRAALYFNQHTDPDSVAPVFKYLLQDAERLLETVEWK